MSKRNSTSILMQVLQSDLLSYSKLSAIRVQWLMATFFAGTFRWKWIIKFLRRLKEGHEQCVDLKHRLKTIEQTMQCTREDKNKLFPTAIQSVRFCWSVKFNNTYKKIRKSNFNYC